MDRKSYLSVLMSLRETNAVKILTGARGVGKSTVLADFADALQKEGIPPADILAVDFDELLSGEELDFDAMREYIKSRITAGEKLCLILDEPPNAAAFEAIVGALCLSRNLDVYVALSNRRDLPVVAASGAACLPVFPLSLAEIAAAFFADTPPTAADYTRMATLPRAFMLQNDPRALKEYVRGNLADIILTEITDKRQIRDISLLKDIIVLLLTRLGEPLSPAKIAALLRENRRGFSVHTAEEYLAALEDAFILRAVPRCDTQTGAVLRSAVQYYFTDTGLSNILLGGKKREKIQTALLKNAVCNELQKKSPKVCSGRAGAKTVDFVAFCPAPKYFQIADKTNRKEKLRTLTALRDQYDKFLLTAEDTAPDDHKGIKIMSVTHFLLNVDIIL